MNHIRTLSYVTFTNIDYMKVVLRFTKMYTQYIFKQWNGECKF